MLATGLLHFSFFNAFVRLQLHWPLALPLQLLTRMLSSDYHTLVTGATTSAFCVYNTLATGAST